MTNPIFAKRPGAAAAAARLRTSPNFALAFAMDGRAYVARQSEPYDQYWLNARERVLFALFGKRGGMTVDDAIAAAIRAAMPTDPVRERARLAEAISAMRAASMLLGAQDDTSRYDAGMAATYLRHRPFPRAVAERIVADAPLAADSAVLDLAGGPGSLALELARVSGKVAMIELSRGFVAAARKEAAARGVALAAIHESANRLPSFDGAYDVITVSQALHWLDDLLVCKGVCRLLNDGGSFFVVHGALTLADEHPLSYILGDRTPLGNKPRLAFLDEVRPLHRRISLLFDALDTPEVARHDPAHHHGHRGRIVPVAATLFRQKRPIDPGFARAFLSDRHIEATGTAPAEFWQDLDRRCAASPDAMTGTQEWALLQFRRGGERNETIDPAMTEIGWDQPAA